MIYFITGASGVGKTTLVSMLQEKHKEKAWSFLHFDEIGVPTESVMREEFGSPSAWQEAMTYRWIEKALSQGHSKMVFLEGQVNLHFIRNGFEKHHFTNYKIILLDCSENVMAKRLTRDRNQPELFNANMRNWLKFLRGQAIKFGAIRIDTSLLTENELMKVLEEAINLKS
jgi:adenylate kinase family enzyme